MPRVLNHADHLMPRHRLEIGELLADGGLGRAEKFARKILRKNSDRPLVVHVVPGEFAACDHAGTHRMEVVGRSVVEDAHGKCALRAPPISSLDEDAIPIRFEAIHRHVRRIPH